MTAMVKTMTSCLHDDDGSGEDDDYDPDEDVFITMTAMVKMMGLTMMMIIMKSS